MDPKAKLTKVLDALENGDKRAAAHADATKKARVQSDEFLNVLLDNVKTKKCSYDEAVLRIKKFSRDTVELYFLLDKLDETVWGRVKTASTEKEGQMNAFERLAKKGFPATAKWYQDTLTKEGYYNGTGEQVDHKDAIQAIEQKRMNESIKGGEQLMDKAMKEKERINRAYYNGTGEAPKHDQWDGSADEEEAKRMKQEVSAGESKAKADAKEKERIQRAMEQVTVKLSLDVAHPKNSKWVVAANADGAVLFEASISDITEGKEVPEEVVAELTSPAYGQMIYENIANEGLEATAAVMLGEKFAKDSEDKKEEKEEKEEEKKEKEEEKKEKEEEKKEKEEEKMEVEKAADATPSKQAAVSVEYFTLKGVLADLKQENELLKNAKVAEQIEATDKDISDLKGMIQENPEDLTSIAKASEKITAKLAALDTLVAKLQEITAEMTPEEKKKDEEAKKKAEEEAKKLAPKTMAAAENVKQAKDGGKEYDVTGKANYQKEFHSGQGDSKDLPDTTIWGLKKEMESLINKKPKGTLASAMDKIKQAGSEYVDSKTKGEMKKYVQQVTGDASYAAGLTNDKSVEQVQKEVKASDVSRVIEAMDLAMRMQKIGMIQDQTKEARDKQVDVLLRMSDEQFAAYKDGIENINPSTEIEDGRYRVEVIGEPNRDVKATIDGKVVAYFKASEIGATKGQITKKALLEALSQTKYAFEEGLFDKILDNKAESNDAAQVDLNVGQEDKRLLERNRLPQL